MMRPTVSIPRTLRSNPCPAFQLHQRPLRNPGGVPSIFLATQASIISPSHAHEPNFQDYQSAFRSKSTFELLRALALFRLCSNTFFVKNAKNLLSLSSRLIGQRPTMWLVKKSFFAHFCAGENGKDIIPTVDRLRAQGVNSILDFAAESDITKQKVTPVVEVTGRSHPEDIEEEECDQNTQIFLQCVDAASQFEQGFAAIKVTALGRPHLLQRVTEILQKIRELFMRFDKDGHRAINLQQFTATLDELGLDMEPAKIQELFDAFDTNKSGVIDYLKWTEYLKVEDLRTRPFFTQANRKRPGVDAKPILPSLSDEEVAQFERMMGRLDKIAQAAAKAKVRLMVDAEQSYFQPAISHAVVNLQRAYNRTFPAVFTTYQCYLRDTPTLIRDDLERARREGFFFAAKMVRGAYMTQERQRAREMGLPDPIWPTLQVLPSVTD